jgi:hypothetical protein
MSPTKPDDRNEQPQGESYVHDPDGAFTCHVMAARTAANSAAFLLPHLHPGQTLLDMGCGLGTITIGLAEAVSPGEVVGSDVEESPMLIWGFLQPVFQVLCFWVFMSFLYNQYE